MTAAAVILAVCVAFLIFYFTNRPSGRLDVVFSKDLSINVQAMAIEPTGSVMFVGGPEGKLVILSETGEEVAQLNTGNPVLELVLLPEHQMVVARMSSQLISYTYDGKAIWKREIPDYYAESIQVLPKSKLGAFFRSKKGEKPYAVIMDQRTGKEYRRVKLDVEAFDIQPVFSPTGDSIIFEVQPAVVSRVSLVPQLPMLWKANLDTRAGRFSSLAFKMTDSGLLVCYFTRDSKEAEGDPTVSDLFVFDLEKVPKKDQGTQEIQPFWQVQVQGRIDKVEADNKSDIVLVQAGTVQIFGRNGETIVKEPEGSKYYYSYLGLNRYVSAFFLDEFSRQGTTTQFVAKGIGRDGVLWRYTDIRNFLVPAVTPDCETMLLASMEKKKITLLRMSR